MNVSVWLLSILLVTEVASRHEQTAERTAQRLVIANDMVTDLMRDKDNAIIFEKYLASSGRFPDARTAEVANNWTTGLKESLARFSREQIIIYHYPTKPDSVRKVKSIDDPDNNRIEYGPPRIILDSTKPNSKVVLDDLFVVTSQDRKFRFRILFDDQNKVISFCGLLIGDQVTMLEF